MSSITVFPSSDSTAVPITLANWKSPMSSFPVIGAPYASDVSEAPMMLSGPSGTIVKSTPLIGSFVWLGSSMITLTLTVSPGLASVLSTLQIIAPGLGFVVVEVVVEEEVVVVVVSDDVVVELDDDDVVPVSVVVVVVTPDEVVVVVSDDVVVVVSPDVVVVVSPDVVVVVVSDEVVVVVSDDVVVVVSPDVVVVVSPDVVALPHQHSDFAVCEGLIQ